MIRILLPALMLLASPALAHTGHDHGSGFLAGITHPLFGPDHLLAMLAVGLWAGVVGGRAQHRRTGETSVQIATSGANGRGRKLSARAGPGGPARAARERVRRLRCTHPSSRDRRQLDL